MEKDTQDEQMEEEKRKSRMRKRRRRRVAGEYEKDLRRWK